MNRRQTISVPVAAILVEDRLREPDPAAVKALAADIAARGLRQPIEVTARTSVDMPWRLVSGAHRLEACRTLGHAEIDAFVAEGTRDELLRDELLENLARSDLSMLERARFAAELQRLWSQRTSGAGRGGDRRSAEAENPGRWCDAVAQRTGWSAATVERAAELGRRIDREAARLIAGTAAEHNQSELKLLAAEEPAQQRAIAAVIRNGQARGVRAAWTAMGRAERPEGDRLFGKFLRLWARADGETRARILAHVNGEDA
jgi:ParB family chromosome partitioning protein